MKGWKNILQDNGSKRAGVTKPTANTTDLKSKAVNKGQGTIVLIKGWLLQAYVGVIYMTVAMVTRGRRSLLQAQSR